MKKLVSVVVVLVLAVTIGVWLVLSFRAKRKYDEVRAELLENVLTAVPIDAQADALLAEVRANWVEEYSEVDGLHSDALKTIGLDPSVSNLIDVFTYRMPECSLLSPGRNRKPIHIGMVQAQLLPVSIDRSIHVSDDRHLALIRCSTGLVLVFTDDTGGLRETMYYLQNATSEGVTEP